MLALCKGQYKIFDFKRLWKETGQHENSEEKDGKPQNNLRQTQKDWNHLKGFGTLWMASIRGLSDYKGLQMELIYLLESRKEYKQLWKRGAPSGLPGHRDLLYKHVTRCCENVMKAKVWWGLSKCILSLWLSASWSRRAQREKGRPGVVLLSDSFEYLQPASQTPLWPRMYCELKIF